LTCHRQETHDHHPRQHRHGFDNLGLAKPLLDALAAVGYETPSPIQAACIPPLLAGQDLLGEAQTGTGKTAAFALPLLQKIDLARAVPQALVLTPTRELAIQVSEALQKYAHFLPGFHVLPVYGGQSMVVQLRQLSRGAHVIVGTPGRVMDHLERKSLMLDKLSMLVLDEADEMLRMGFIDDVEWILEHTPETRQTALFSATMPDPIRRVAHKHLRNPEGSPHQVGHHHRRRHQPGLLPDPCRAEDGGPDPCA
jgi:ATP-dependent RNA helicase DeaD